MSLPNRITLIRFLLAIVLFFFLSQLEPPNRIGYFEGLQPGTPEFSRILNIAWIFFFLGALTDALDGYLARKLELQTDLGRIADPFVDKIYVCGSFVFLSSAPDLAVHIEAWMVVLVIGREFLITGLRGYVESKGHTFPAGWWGKIKMFLQCSTVVAILFTTANFPESPFCLWTTHIILWAMLVSTFTSAVLYCRQAHRVSRFSL
ncbi:MAG: CDP-diacylglycerol--glycerol-3-phosphate 3-phosphatidyltransferase [Planctomycetota bacterium]|jgi:CDP-diacylglycerol--glycerol-3-phosphate 3-phosphatidyltransferase|nr:CDP-diacylglycerol--glycerol-3-phosphate 3-phosphatidyltransferase [Planctomycetota bacterium]